MEPWPRLDIDNDPELLIFHIFLQQCIEHPEGCMGYHLTVNHTDGHRCPRIPCFIGSILRHDGSVYRIDEYEPTCGSWWARWPD